MPFGRLQLKARRSGGPCHCPPPCTADVDRFDLVSVMKVRDGEGLDAGLFGRFLIVVVEVLRVEDDTVERLGHCRGCKSDVA